MEKSLSKSSTKYLNNTKFFSRFIMANSFYLRRLTGLMLSMAIIGGLYAQTGKVQLHGKLKNFSNQVEVQDLSEYQYLLPPTAERMIVPDTAGNFRISFRLNAPNYFRLGRNILYLSPGDSMEIFVDYMNNTLAQFTGRGSAANKYLRHTPFPKGGSYLEAGRKLQRTAQASIDTILQIGKLRQLELDALTGVSSEFKKLEGARIRADVINSLLAGQRSYKPRMSKDSLVVYQEEYDKLVEPVVADYSKDFINASYMKLVVYRDIAAGLSKGNNTAAATAIREWYTASTLLDSMKKVSDKGQLKTFSSAITKFQTAGYRNALNSSLETLLAFGKGDVAVDFMATDITGKQVTLSSLKGKVIYVDLWATWCGPCMVEMPHFEKLKEKFADNPNVAMVSLSIDDAAALWKRSVEGRNANGIQWLINRNKLDAYNIVSIPRTLLIDKNFKVVDINAPAPSSPKIETMITQLLGAE